MSNPDSDESFEKLIVWQRAKNVSIEIYKRLSDCRDKGHGASRTKSLVPQTASLTILPKVLSVPEKQNFDNFSATIKSSVGEARSQIYRAQVLNYIDAEDAQRLIAELKEMGK